MDELVIDYEAPSPPHRQIAAWLRRAIESGELPPGKRLPTEAAIVQMTGVAATTVRRAIKLLRQEGLIFTVQGRGSYVGNRAPE
jgi:DNA-binding GntR family transcriptional regulator